MKKHFVFLSCGMTLLCMELFSAELPEIKVDVAQVRHTMRGGMGASWHAIGSKDWHELPGHNKEYKYSLSDPAQGNTPRRARGSAFGGNPPVTDQTAWKQIKQHASWLGMNFLRVELDQRMYEPEQGKFDWENEEMQALYLILDWCQQNDADVFLQQMWAFVEWNAYPDVHPLISAPRDLDAFANGIATLLDHLIKTKGYTCIKYFCMVNEPPGGTWGWWWEYGDAEGKMEDAWKKLKEVFDARKINVLLSGPDWTTNPPFDETNLTFAPYLGSIDIHSYSGADEANLKKWADWAHANKKPFFLSEFGHPLKPEKPFESALSVANYVIRALRADVDGLNRWSYTNRGDLDGAWQLIKTYDPVTKEYLKTIEPESEAFYSFGILSRFFAKYSSVVECSASDPDNGLLTAALLSPGGDLSVFLLNQTDKDVSICLNIVSLPEKRMNLYQVAKETVSKPDFKLDAIQHFPSSETTLLILPAKSITTVSSYTLTHGDNGIIGDTKPIPPLTP